MNFFGYALVAKIAPGKNETKEKLKKIYMKNKIKKIYN